MSQETDQQIFTNHVAADMASDAGKMSFIIRSALAKVRTALPVQVLAVSNSGGLSPVGTVNIQPLVNAVDGNGNSWPHGIIYNVPYMRIQGGGSGIIIDPQVNDIGIAVVCDRDISTVQNVGNSINSATGNNFTSAPGSNRKNDMSDMVYLMTMIGLAPTQYIQFNSTGITIHSPTKVTITAPSIASSGAWSHTGAFTASGEVTANGTTPLHTHVHGGVTAGSGNTGAPTA